MLASAAVIALLVVMAVQEGRSEPEQGIDRGGPLPGYPPCSSFVPEESQEHVEGALLPRSATITRVRERGPVRRIAGYVSMTPVQLRRHYASREDLEVLQIEDEIIEAEVLLTDGVFRMYVKAQAVCDLGSSFDAIVALEKEADVVPAPAGSGT